MVLHFPQKINRCCVTNARWLKRLDSPCFCRLPAQKLQPTSAIKASSENVFYPLQGELH